MRNPIEIINVNVDDKTDIFTGKESDQTIGWVIMRVGDRYLMVSYSEYFSKDSGSCEMLKIVSGSDQFQFNFGSKDDPSNEVHSIDDYYNKTNKYHHKIKAFEKIFGIELTKLYLLVVNAIYIKYQIT